MGQAEFLCTKYMMMIQAYELLLKSHEAADRPPEEIIMFRKMIKALSVICHVRVLGKVTLVDKKGRRW